MGFLGAKINLARFHLWENTFFEVFRAKLVEFSKICNFMHKISFLTIYLSKKKLVWRIYVFSTYLGTWQYLVVPT